MSIHFVEDDEQGLPVDNSDKEENIITTGTTTTMTFTTTSINISTTPSPTMTMTMSEEDGMDDELASPHNNVANEDIDIEKNCFGSTIRTKGSISFWFYTILTILIVIGSTITVVVLLHNHNNSNNMNTQPESSSTTSPPKYVQQSDEYYKERYTIFYSMITPITKDISTLLQSDTPQYKALYYMVYTDTTIPHDTLDGTNGDTSSSDNTQRMMIQRYTILVFYYTCGGEGWYDYDQYNNINELGNVDTCQWSDQLDPHPYIVCSSDDTTTNDTKNEIIELNLVQFQLYGTIPYELHTLSSLITLDVSYNFLKGTIPYNLFSNMTNLQNLYINNNELIGTLPISIGYVTSLQNLTLGYNYFTGTIPNVYKSLQQLQLFHIQDTMISGPFFNTFGPNWKQIQSLNIDNTQLTGTIPSSVLLSWSNTILNLHLGKSLLHGTYPIEINTLSKLTNFNSIGTQFYGSIPNISSLTNLKSFTLQGTMLTGTIPTTIGLFHQLQDLSIRFTSISGTIPTEIGMCTNLQELTITSTKITGNIPNEIIHIPRLNAITLTDNDELVGSIPSTFCPDIVSGITFVTRSCNIECTCCTDMCT